MSSQGMDDLVRQLPPDLVAQLSQQLGVDESTARQGLADVLPGLAGAAGQPGGDAASYNAFVGSGGGADTVLGSLSADGADALQVGDAASPAPDPGGHSGLPGGLESGGADPMGGLTVLC